MTCAAFFVKVLKTIRDCVIIVLTNQKCKSLFTVVLLIRKIGFSPLDAR